MIKTVTQFEHKIGDKTFHFYCDCFASIWEVHEALTQMTGFVLDIKKKSEIKPEEKAPDSKEEST